MGKQNKFIEEWEKQNVRGEGGEGKGLKGHKWKYKYVTILIKIL
jgi:hypothetical protein